MRGRDSCSNKRPSRYWPIHTHSNSNRENFKIRNKSSSSTCMIFLVEFVKKVLKTHVILIICPKFLCKKIDYVERLLHALLNYLIFLVIFSKNCFSKEFPIFSLVSLEFHPLDLWLTDRTDSSSNSTHTRSLLENIIGIDKMLFIEISNKKSWFADL
jgi:hypothetical protein